jgi:hypothetical protein
MSGNNEKPRPRIIITLHPGGGVEINGPLHDKILCFGMLKMAENMVGEWKPEKKQMVVVPQIQVGKLPNQ